MPGLDDENPIGPTNPCTPWSSPGARENIVWDPVGLDRPPSLSLVTRMCSSLGCLHSLPASYLNRQVPGTQHPAISMRA